MANNAFLVSLQRCTGCWTCAMSCKVNYDLAPDEFRMFVRTIGNGRIDEPGGKWPDVWMKWMPIWTKKCISCPDRVKEGKEPMCAYNCPSEAIYYGDLDDPESDISRRKAELEEKGFHIFQLPEREDTRSNVYYAER